MKFVNLLVRHASWRNTIILLGVQFAIQGVILFWAYPRIGGVGIPLDMRSGLSAPEIREFLASIGPDGRTIYALNELTLDFLFPLLYSSAYAFLFLRLVLPMTGRPGRWCLLSLLPFGIAAADIGENLSISGAIAAYPGSGAWPRAVITFNSVKGSIMMLTIAVLFLIVAIRLVLPLLKRGKKSS